MPISQEITEEEKIVLAQCEEKIHNIAAANCAKFPALHLKVDKGVRISIKNCQSNLIAAILGQIRGLSQAGNGAAAAWEAVDWQSLSFPTIGDLALALNAGIKSREEKIDLSRIHLTLSRV